MASFKPRFWVISSLVLLVLLGSASGIYFYFHGREYHYRLSEQYIQEKLVDHLPITKSYLALFQVTLDNARVSLKDGSDRINVGVDITLNISINNAPEPLGGSVDVSAGIKYVAEDGAFFLVDPVIEHFTIQGLPEKYRSQAQVALTKALTEFYTRYPLYTLDTEKGNQLAARLVLRRVIVENQEVVITLGI